MPFPPSAATRTPGRPAADGTARTGQRASAAPGRVGIVIDDFAKEYLHHDLRQVREAVLWKLDGLSEYDVRRPLTASGTNLLGLVKHLSFWEARYLGEVFGRPFPEPLPRWDEPDPDNTDMWVGEHESARR